MDPPQPLTRLFVSTVSANLGGLLVGLQLALFSGILEIQAFHEAMEPTLITSQVKSLITSALVIGTILGAIPAGPLCDKAGRRPALLLTATLFALSTVIMARASGVGQVVLGRFLAGMAYAIANIVCPMYSAELAPPAWRGIIVNLYQLLITAGILVAQLCNWAFWTDAPWNGALMLAVVLALEMALAVAVLVPESPTWLFANGRGMEARAALFWLRLPADDDVEIGRDLDTEKGDDGKGGLWEMVRDPSARKRLLIGAGLGAAQQFSGINAVIFFGPKLVADVLGLEGSSAPFKAAAVVGLGNFLAGLASMAVIEGFGRRRLLLTAGAPMMGSLVTLGLMRDGWVARSGVVGVGALLTFICAFAMTYGPLPFVVASEIFPVRYKGIGMSTCSMVLSLCSLAIAAGFLPMLEWLGGGVYYFYATCVAASSLFIYLFVPETRNMSLKDIDNLLST